VDVHADPSPSTTAANDANTLRVASITTNDVVEYIDAADANEYLIHQQHIHTNNYILSLTKDQSFVREPYLSRWPREWTEKVDALKKSNMDGWIQHARVMNCMEMFGLGITKDNALFVRDHKGRGCPHVFWRHNYTGKSAVIVHWEVGTGNDVDVAGRVLKKPIPLDYNVDYDESSSPHGSVLQPPFNAYKEVLQECFVVAGVNDHSSLIAALNKYKDQESRLNEIVNA
jgi:hypothetical protein